MDNKVFSLACSGKNSWSYAWELELGNPEYRRKLAEGDAVIFKLEDGTQMCLKMASSYILLAESVTTEGERSMDWYWANNFEDDDEEELLFGDEFLKRIYNRARRKKSEELLGAFAE